VGSLWILSCIFTREEGPRTIVEGTLEFCVNLSRDLRVVSSTGETQQPLTYIVAIEKVSCTKANKNFRDVRRMLYKALGILNTKSELPSGRDIKPQYHDIYAQSQNAACHFAALSKPLKRPQIHPTHPLRSQPHLWSASIVYRRRLMANSVGRYQPTSQ
jgi:hypothetical protein